MKIIKLLGLVLLASSILLLFVLFLGNTKLVMWWRAERLIAAFSSMVALGLVALYVKAKRQSATKSASASVATSAVKAVIVVVAAVLLLVVILYPTFTTKSPSNISVERTP